MKPVKDYAKLPKFLQVNNWQVEKSHNKYLPNPYHQGEIVKVQNEEFQEPDNRYNDKTPRVTWMSRESWRRKYCRILRKDSSGKFTHSCSLEWRALDYIKRK